MIFFTVITKILYLYYASYQVQSVERSRNAFAYFGLLRLRSVSVLEFLL